MTVHRPREALLDAQEDALDAALSLIHQQEPLGWESDADGAEDLAATIASINDIAPIEAAIPFEAAPRVGWHPRGADIIVTVESPREQEHLLLAFDQGVYRWVYPSDDSGDTPDGPSSREVFSYSGPSSEGVGGGADLHTLATVSEMWSIGRKALLFLFRKPAEWATKKIVELLDRRIEPGLVRCAEEDPSTWRHVAPESLDLPDSSSALLLIHGFLSNTEKAFDGLAGSSIISDATTKYDVVLGFDHPTLSVDPGANASELLRLLHRLPASQHRFDVITHSRGGLVYRSLVETMQSQIPPSMRIGPAVLVAGPQAGTTLAAYDNWKTLFDVCFNILNRIPGWASKFLESLLVLVHALTRSATANPAVAPGIHALGPGSPFLRGLNRHTPKPPGPYFAIDSNFEPANQVFRVLDEAVDRFFGGGNDLIVDTASMISIDDVDVPAGRRLDLSPSPVHHFGYFDDGRVRQAIRQWMSIP
ncbi:MAG: hypothetical protein KQH83_12135 [Actinobacteria bacterium]|nr:hypothetical protein [Actinomycetota bacterium]